MPVAVNCSVYPLFSERIEGVTAMETSAARVTVNVAEPLIAAEVAVIVAVPTPLPVANPSAPIVATEVEDELQLTALVRSCVLPSVYIPTASNC